MTSPTAGYSWVTNDKLTIRWVNVGASIPTTDALAITLFTSSGGSSLRLDNGQITNTGAFTVTLPVSAHAGPSYLVVSDNNNNLFTGQSDTFTVVGPSVNVSSPTAVWPSGGAFTVTWSSLGLPDQPMTVSYLRQNQWQAYSFTAEVQLDVGHFTCVLPDSLGSGFYGANAYLTVSTTSSNPSFSFQSDMFTTVGPVVNVTYPTSATAWRTGINHTIRWSTDNFSPRPATVSVVLKRNNDFSKQWTLGTNVPNTGSLNALITGAISASQNNYIEIDTTLSSGTAISGTSDLFTTLGRHIDVVYPAANQVVANHCPLAVRWTSSGFEFPHVSISLVNAQCCNQNSVTLVASMPNNGSATVTPPLAGSAGIFAGTYQIEIASVEDGSIQGTSSSFSMPGPSLTVVRPFANEAWVQGSTVPVVWSYVGMSSSDFVDIAITRPSSGSRLVLVSNSFNGGYLHITVPQISTLGGQGQLYLTVSLTAYPSISSQSPIFVVTSASPNPDPSPSPTPVPSPWVPNAGMCGAPVTSPSPAPSIAPPSPSASPEPSASTRPSQSPTPLPSGSPSAAPSAKPSASVSPAASRSPSPKVSHSPAPSHSVSPLASSSASASPKAPSHFTTPSPPPSEPHKSPVIFFIFCILFYGKMMIT